MAMATEESTAEVVTELPEIGFEVVKSIQDAVSSFHSHFPIQHGVLVRHIVLAY